MRIVVIYNKYAIKPYFQKAIMIVCICNNIPESEIRQAVQAGLVTMSSLRKELGVANCCGKCHTCAKQILQECLVSQLPPERKIHFHALVN